MKFSEDFVFGAATAAYQVEGAADEDGRTPSIWDTFSKTPGKTENGDTGDVACDHYHRYREDVGLIKELGVDAYRLSISWPRIFPRRSVYNPKGMEFYKSLMKELKKSGVKVAATLYHWDLPQWAQDLGGWKNRECVSFFLEFAEKCFEELDGLVDLWITLNEPWCSSFLSYALGLHAPGERNIGHALRAAHHLLLAHGETVERYRAAGGKKPIGITLNLSPVYPASGSFADRLAANDCDGFTNRWFLEPLFRGGYPFDMANCFAARGCGFDFIRSGDFDVIARPIDFLGVNFYTRKLVEFDPTGFVLHRDAFSPAAKTDMGWDVAPETLKDLIRRIRGGCTDLPIYITENGAAFRDECVGGRVADPQRSDYIRSHLEAVSEINAEGLNVAGYFYWSLLDNFEWASGYSKRFGLVYTDYATLKRYKKDSFYAYQKIIRDSRRRAAAGTPRRSARGKPD